MKIVMILVSLVIGAYASSFVTLVSEYDGPTTVEKITQKIDSKKDVSIFTIIDHKKNASSVGLKLPFTQVIIFGNPKAGTKLMQADMLMAYELPMRILVYEKDGKVMVTYKKPEYYNENYELKNSPIPAKMKKMLAYLISSIH